MKRFRISHLFVSLLNLAGVALTGYFIYLSIDTALWFHWACIFSMIVVLPAFILFCYATYNSLKLFAHEIKTGESFSYYEEKDN